MKLSIVLMVVLVVALGTKAQQEPASQNSTDADNSAAVAAIQKLQADANAVSSASSQAALGNVNSMKATDGDTTAAAAALAQVQAAADKLAASTPDANTLKKLQYLQHRRELDAESKKDMEIFKEKVSDKLANGGLQPEVEIGAKSAAQAAIDSLNTASEAGSAFLDASTPSYTAGPTADMGPLFSPQETQELENKLKQYSDAQQQYQEALQNLNNVMANTPKNSLIPSPSTVKGAQAPQIKAGGQAAPLDCVVHHYNCNK